MRVYKRMTDRKPVTPEMLAEAEMKIASGMSKRKVAEHFCIDESTLRKRLKRGTGVNSLGRFKCILTPDHENQLAQHCKLLDNMFYGLTFKSLRSLAYQFAVMNKISNPFNSETQMAGIDWAKSFIRRNNLTLRSPQKTSVARIMGFNKVQCDLFFENLITLMEKYNFSPSEIFNMDETGMTTVPNKIPRVITDKGKRAIGKVVSAERGQLVTAVCCMNAVGNYVSPALIFPRKREKVELMNGAPPGSVMFISDSGYINAELFIKWLGHFRQHVQASEQKPVLLILDNHSSHVSLEAVVYCRKHNIHMLSLPPHSSHKMQPLDRCFFKSLKDYYSDFCDQWLVSNAGRVITQFQVAQLFGKAYMKNCTIERAAKAFEVCGILPVDKYKFDEVDFLPSQVTEQKIEDEDSQTDVENREERQSPQPSTSGQSSQNQTPQPSTSGQSSQNLPSKKATEEPAYYSPSNIIPTPKTVISRKRMRKGKKSTILTSTPHKTALETERRKPTVANKRRLFVCKQERIQKKKNQPPTSERIICPGCECEYADPPTEDWIQCASCQEWWHENCTSYEGGRFKCDLC